MTPVSAADVPVGVFLNLEALDPEQDDPVREVGATARLAERLGYSTVWVSEHHANGHTQSASIAVLLAHLAAVTGRIRLGAAAFLLPCHDMVRLAEDIATLDRLSSGRLEVGVARGGPFPQQDQLFNVRREQAGSMTAGRLDRLLAVVNGSSALTTLVDGSGCPTVAAAEPGRLWPRPMQHQIPFHLASQSPAGFAAAIDRGIGVLVGQATPTSRVTDCLRDAGRPLSLTITRSVAVAATQTAAEVLADEGAADFVDTMRRAVGPGFPLTAAALRRQMVAGDEASVATALNDLLAQLPEAQLVVKPAPLQTGLARSVLQLFADGVLPRLRRPLPSAVSPGQPPKEN